MNKEEINKKIKELEFKKITIETEIAVLKTQLRKLEENDKDNNKEIIQ